MDLDAPMQPSRAPATLAVTLLFTALLWVGLAPWRPVLAGDDFGYYDSVVRSLTESRVVVSDWLNPFTVGLTVPAEGMVLLCGNLWPGCTLTVLAFGLIGLFSLAALLQRLSGGAQYWAVFLWAFFPPWLAKWTHFESAVPATSLMLLALVLYWEAMRRGGFWSWTAMAAAACSAAWAISIRQNHVVLVGVGCGALLLDRRPRSMGLLLIWLFLPLGAFAYLQFGMARSYAQDHMQSWQLATLTPIEYLSRLLRGWCFAAGCAVGFLLLTDFTRMRARLCLRAPRCWLAGGISLVALAAGALLAPSAVRWLAPRSDVLYLDRVPIIPALATIAGALCWPALLSRAGALREFARSPGLALLVAGAGYVALAAVWGYWEYYFLDVTVLLWLAGTMALKSDASGPGHCAPPRVGAWCRTAVVCLAALSWFGQRVLLDLHSAQTEIAERCFRDGVARAADCRGLPFGLAGWNMFPCYAQRWRAAPEGNPLAFWRMQHEPAPFRFRWRGGVPDLSNVPEVVRSGTLTAGLRKVQWSLLAVGESPSYQPLTAEHRFLPLTRQEWAVYLTRLKEVHSTDSGAATR